MTYSVEESISACERLSEHAKSSFVPFFGLLPPDQKQAMKVVYAFMKQTDSLVDAKGTDTEKQERLNEWRISLDRALTSNDKTDRYLTALAKISTEYGIAREDLHEVIAGEEMDVSQSRYDTFEQLYEYCYRVASAVGFVCVRIWNCPNSSDLRRAAEACGIAFQLTNILRDVKQDWLKYKRIYIPKQDLELCGYSYQRLEKDLKSRKASPEFVGLMKLEIDRAREYYAIAQTLAVLVPSPSRSCFVAMFDAYSELLNNVEARRVAGFVGKVSLPPHALDSIARRFIPTAAVSEPTVVDVEVPAS